MMSKRMGTVLRRKPSWSKTEAKLKQNKPSGADDKNRIAAKKSKMKQNWSKVEAKLKPSWSKREKALCCQMTQNSNLVAIWEQTQIFWKSHIDAKLKPYQSNVGAKRKPFWSQISALGKLFCVKEDLNFNVKQLKFLLPPEVRQPTQQSGPSPPPNETLATCLTWSKCGC